MKKLYLIIILSITVSFMYFYISYYKLTQLDITHTLHYAVNPEDYFKDTFYYLPGTSNLAEKSLYNKDLKEFDAYFADVYTQPYFVLNLYTAYDENIEERKKTAFQLTNYLISKGFAIDKIDKNGCSSIHNAILQNSDSEIIEYLSDKGAFEKSHGVPYSKIDLCKKDAIELKNQVVSRK